MILLFTKEWSTAGLREALFSNGFLVGLDGLSYDDTEAGIRKLKKISKLFPGTLLTFKQTPTSMNQYIRDGHFVDANGVANPCLSRITVSVQAPSPTALKEAIEDIYLRLRVYDFGKNFGKERLSKALTSNERRNLNRRISGKSSIDFNVDVLGIEFFDKTLSRLSKKHPTLSFLSVQVTKDEDYLGADITTEIRKSYSAA